MENNKLPILRVILVVVITAVLLIALPYIYTHVHFYTEEFDIPASCGTPGYHYKICGLCGEAVTEVTSGLADHRFSEWQTDMPSTLTDIGTEKRVCEVCTFSEIRKADSLSSLPKFYIYGSANGISYDSYVHVTSYYEENGEKAERTASVRLLRSGDVKKFGYDIVLDGESVSFGTLGSANVLHLHADNDDNTRLRRVAAAELFREALGGEYDPAYDELYRAEGADGEAAVGNTRSGYKTLLYVNDKYAGMYTLSLPFNAYADAESMRYAVRYTDRGILPINGGEDAVEAFRAFADFVDTHEGWALTSGLAEYADADQLIRFYAACEVMGAFDTLNDETVWVSADGQHWTPLPDNLEDCYGIRHGEAEVLDAAYPLTFDEPQGSGLIWNKVAYQYYGAAKKQMVELLNGPLAPAHVAEVFDAASALYPEELFRREGEVYYGTYDKDARNVPFAAEWAYAREHFITIYS